MTIACPYFTHDALNINVTKIMKLSQRQLYNTYFGSKIHVDDTPYNILSKSGFMHNHDYPQTVFPFIDDNHPLRFKNGSTAWRLTNANGDVQLHKIDIETTNIIWAYNSAKFTVDCLETAQHRGHESKPNILLRQIHDVEFMFAAFIKSRVWSFKTLWKLYHDPNMIRTGCTYNQKSNFATDFCWLHVNVKPYPCIIAASKHNYYNIGSLFTSSIVFIDVDYDHMVKITNQSPEIIACFKNNITKTEQDLQDVKEKLSLEGVNKILCHCEYGPVMKYHLY